MIKSCMKDAVTPKERLKDPINFNLYEFIVLMIIIFVIGSLI